RQAAIRMILAALGAVLVLLVAGSLVKALGAPAPALAAVLFGLWTVFTAFTLYFFRDPEPDVPEGRDLVVSPGTGMVDAIDTVSEPEFMRGECQRISTFLSVLDVHVQRAPVSGRLAYFKYNTGRFLSALKSESATHNENVLLGFEAGDPRG